jgi:hypothetical protein
MASTTTTTFLNLTLPTPTVQIGPTWASQINAAFEVIDEHDHTSGKGVRVPTAGLNINADLDFNLNAALNLEFGSFQNRTTSPSGSTFARAVSVFQGNLYFTNGSGVAVQITDGGSIISSPGNAQVFQTQAVSSNLTIGPSDTFVYLIVDTTADREITLPLANAVTAGRIYIIKDSSGQSNTNNITVSAAGSDTLDGESSQILNSNYGSWTLVTDGVSNWYIS